VCACHTNLKIYIIYIIYVHAYTNMYKRGGGGRGKEEG
jgi:hypothetical protein